MMEHTERIRYRLSVSTSVKGVVTPDYTVEVEGLSEEEFWRLQEHFRAEVERRYPAPEVT
jgi:hypothetical protein